MYIEGEDEDRKSNVFAKIRWRTMISCTAWICLSSFLFGYIVVTPSLILTPISTHRGSFNYRAHVTKLHRLFIQSAVIMGGTLGAVINSIYPLLDIYGRRNTLLATNAIFIAGAMITSVANNTSLTLIIGLFVEGIGVGLANVIVPILLSEISPTMIRSSVVCCMEMFIAIGILCNALLTLFFIDIPNGWNYVVSIVIVVAFAQVVFGLCFIPESPRWLLYKMQRKKAFKSFAQFFVDEDDAQHDFATFEAELSKSEIYINYRRALLIGVLLSVFDQFTGISIVCDHATKILNNSGIDNSEYVVLIVYGVKAVTALILVLCVLLTNISHSKFLCLGTFAMFATLLTLSIIALMYDENEEQISQLSITKLPLFIAAFQMSLGPLKWLIVVELFPLSLRARYVSLCIGVRWLLSSITQFDIDDAFHLLGNGNAEDGTAVVFLICCFFLLFLFVFVWKVLPETKGLTLELATKKYEKRDDDDNMNNVNNLLL